jgi:hypothetical protein
MSEFKRQTGIFTTLWARLSDKYYDFKHGISNLWSYRKIVWRDRPWDYCYVLEMMSFQLKRLSRSIEHGHEEMDGRMKHVEDINRAIELMQNMIDDNYSERCGMTYSRFNSLTVEERSEIYNRANQLYESELDEWKTLIGRISDWWD